MHEKGDREKNNKCNSLHLEDLVAKGHIWRTIDKAEI